MSSFDRYVTPPTNPVDSVAQDFTTQFAWEYQSDRTKLVNL
jgi:hypothetical protein